MLTFYLKKLGLNDIFGMRREPNRRRIKRRHAQKKICIKADDDQILSTNATPSKAEFNDLYRGCENLQVIRALQKQKPQCKAQDDDFTFSRLLVKLKKSFSCWVDQICLQSNIACLIITTLVGFMELS